jgi:hypothetical protein
MKRYTVYYTKVLGGWETPLSIRIYAESANAAENLVVERGVCDYADVDEVIQIE